MKKIKKDPKADKGCPRRNCPKRRFLQTCGKAMLITASYQIFSMGMNIGSMPCSPTPNEGNSLFGNPNQISSAFIDTSSAWAAPPVNECYCAAYHGSCSCTSCTGCTGCKGCTGCTGCEGCTGCTGCEGCTGCTSALIEERNNEFKELWERGIAVYNHGNKEEALEMFDRAFAIGANISNIKELREWVRQQKEAIRKDKEFNEQEKQRQRQAYELNEKGRAYYNNADWEKALESFREALKYDPKSEAIRSNIELAEKQRDKALELDREERDKSRAAAEMRQGINSFVNRPSIAVPPSELNFMPLAGQEARDVANPRIAGLMKEVDNIKVPPPLRPGDSPVTMADFKVSDKTSKNILFGTDIGVATAEVALKLYGTSMTIVPKLILATGKTFIAMENGADLYLLKQDNIYKEALHFLKNKQTAPQFSAIVRALKEKKQLPANVSPEMLRTARAIIDPKLGNSGWHMAWSAMWSPEAKAAGISRACIELGSELIGRGAEGTVRSMIAARDPAYKSAVREIAAAEAMLKTTRNAEDRAVLEEVIRRANSIMVRAYDAAALGMVNIEMMLPGEEESK